MNQVLLASMPWAHHYMPSIQVGVLKSYLVRSGFEVIGAHWFLDIAHALGFGNYARTWYPYLEDGEALYSYLLFPEKRTDLLQDPQLQVKREAIVDSDIHDTFGHPYDLSPAFFAAFDQLHDRILHQYDWTRIGLVGFTLNFGQTLSSLYMARRIKELAPDTKIVFGGAEASGRLGRSLLANFNHIDFACSGEGEQCVTGLAEWVINGRGEPRTVPGLIYRTEDGIAENPSQQIGDLNSIPLPDMSDYFDAFRKWPGIDALDVATHYPIEASRGCPYQCSFCALNIQWDGFRRKTGQSVAAEMREISDRYELLDFFFVDNVNPGNAEQLFAEVEKLGRDFRFFFEIRSNIPYRALAQMKRAGLVRVQIGIEALNTGLLRKFNKKATFIHNLQAMKNCFALRINVAANLIVDHPASTPEDVDEAILNIDYASAFPPPDSFSAFALEVGAPDFDHCVNGGIDIAGNFERYRRIYPDHFFHLLDLPRKQFTVKNPTADWTLLVPRYNEWKERFETVSSRLGEYVPHLGFLDGGSFMRVEDYRSGEREVFTITGVERRVILAAQEIIARRVLLSECGTTPEELDSALAALLEARLVYLEDDKILALPLPLHLRDLNFSGSARQSNSLMSST